MMAGILFCLVYAYVHKEQRGKGEPQRFVAIYLGCSHTERAFKVRKISTGKKYCTTRRTASLS